MIGRLLTYESEGTDPHRNLAIEQHLLESVLGGCCLLYLWQNRNTVVIGRNQNAWQECRTALLFEEGGRLARRLSGGGAVYHDLGNLNFTFLMRSEDYDLARQIDVIRTACRLCGIETEVSGRNDLTVGGRKFSGNAFYHHEGRSYHHGTLLLNVDTARMGRYLSPSKAKLESKGVESVRSRVVNLCEIRPELTVAEMKAALTEAFGAVYGLSTKPFGAIDEARVGELTAHYAGDAWLFGQRMPFTFRCESRFPWGGAELQLFCEHGAVKDVKVYTDDMDANTASAIERALCGSPFSLAALSARLEAHRVPHARDLIQMLTEQEI